MKHWSLQQRSICSVPEADIDDSMISWSEAMAGRSTVKEKRIFIRRYVRLYLTFRSLHLASRILRESVQNMSIKMIRLLSISVRG